MGEQKRTAKPGSMPPLFHILAHGLLFLNATVLCTSPSYAWVGLELDAGAKAAAYPYAAGSIPESGSLQNLEVRLMVQEGKGSMNFEGHLLASASKRTGSLALAENTASAPFRAWDLEADSKARDSTVLRSELDRFSVTLDAGDSRVTLGRQAITWGEAYYYNIGDLFGAFPITETNRLHKPGIDAITATKALGPFSDLVFSAIPSGSRLDGAAFRSTFPVGEGSFSLTMGRIGKEVIGGTGCTLDLSGTKLYLTWILSNTTESDVFQETVVGVERQIGPYTHLVAEVYRNGWGATEPSDYPALMLSERFLTGRALSLARWSAVLALDRQLTPLWTGSAAVFANIMDGSALLRLDGNRSLSDISDLRLGISGGVGERPSGTDAGSEFGAVPTTVFAEAVLSF